MELQKILNIFEEHGFNENNCSFFRQEDIIDIAKDVLKAINYTRCCTKLNPEFEIGEQVLLTKRTVVNIETFCEDGMIEIEDNNEYYKVDKEELSKRV